MMRQYLGLKAQVPDAFLFYRMGDFYELFFEDAERAAPLLEITLTTRDKNKPDPIPMCGVPVHSAEGYIRKLADLGHRVALCEQVEDAKQAAGRKLVRREVVEVVTPGLVGDPTGLAGSQEVALAVIARLGGAFGLAVLDASTGNFRATSADAAPDGGLPSSLSDELERIAPRELLVGPDWRGSVETLLDARIPATVLRVVDSDHFDPECAPGHPHGFLADAADPRMAAAGAALRYLADHQPAAMAQAPRLRLYGLADAMVLDGATRRHLELFESHEDRSRSGTLIERMDDTRTALGARCLARWMAYPLIDPNAIRARQDGVAALFEDDRGRHRLREALGGVRDLERIFARCQRPGAEPRDVAALRDSIAALPGVATALAARDGGLLAEVTTALRMPKPLPELDELLADALVDEPKPLPRGSRGANETGYIRAGFRSELDVVREAASKGREWIAGLEAEEKERTGISTLKVRFHPVHGYALEVTKTNLDRVPEDYERKQTLKGAERFTTPALREMEGSVLGATERAAALEREIFEEVRQTALSRATEIREAAEAVGELDALQSLAEVARQDGWVRPVVDEGTGLSVTAGRHPVVEHILRRAGEEYVANDTELDPRETQLLLMTGPNMSGKSTYLRQVAILVLLAQMGSFLPAEAARIGVVDRVFTRVGASDRLARGESTFMVEMRETAEILAQASPRSLIILDEIGRGTSTFDGLSIAWAVAEYLHDTPGLRARTLFATHYHELADLARTRAAVENAHFEAREWKEEVLFLRRLAPGPANRSYGIQVARLAGLPSAVIERAREILARLEEDELSPDGRPRLAGQADGPQADAQLALFSTAGPDPTEEEVLGELRALEPDDTTPRQALELLAAWRKRLGKGSS
ncbi:MAG: DNA mismatch repair protein MutS [Deltaproteobacteria bacterium]|nr:DNA mismatch repair protein MutS [Deltaproteobacteria bacterium]MBW2394245.1 DNA mismatch repair protein MutS [Deltaproteobacteria bacterium]